MNPIKADTATLTAERDYWYKEAIAAQEMLAQVLVKIGGKIEIPTGNPLPDNVGIFIDLDEARGVFIFDVAEKDDEGNRV